VSVIDRVGPLLHARWDAELIPVLSDYVRIPNRSPMFDPDWEAAGHMERSVALLSDWARRRPIPGLSVEVARLPGRTPVIVCEVPAHATDATGTVLLYGHHDVQPEMDGWRDGLSPWEPVREGDRLYGRGVADDGYSLFAALSAIEAVHEAGGAHARCVVLIEGSEESGSPDLPAYVEALRGRLGQVELVVTLDSGGPTYDRLWTTTALRGLVSLDLRVDVLEHEVHSGVASGAVASSMRVMRLLLDRVEDAATGRVLVDAMHVEVPAGRRAEAEAVVAAAGALELPLVPGMRYAVDDPVERLLATTWRPTLSITGAAGIPLLAAAGNVVRPSTTLRLSFRLPPPASSTGALAAVEAVLRDDPPYGARVTVERPEAADGWVAPGPSAWLASAAHDASRAWFGAPAAGVPLGGSIPFMAMLGREFPEAEFLIVGVLGPDSNEHGPNEYLDLAQARRITGCVADVLIAHARRDTATPTTDRGRPGATGATRDDRVSG
jgi:acetylornithine deacetylase/succinyl-diaminopimelate desuccinylase-like protein